MVNNSSVINLSELWADIGSWTMVGENYCARWIPASIRALVIQIPRNVFEMMSKGEELCVEGEKDY